MNETSIKTYLDILESNRRQGKVTEAPGFFSRSAFNEAGKRQGKKLKVQIQDNVMDQIIENQSKLRKNLMTSR